MRMSRSYLFIIFLFVFQLRPEIIRAQSEADQSFQNNGDNLLFLPGQAYNNELVSRLLKELNDSAYYTFDGAKPQHSFDIPSKGIGLDFNINFTLSGIRLYDDGFSRLQYPWDLPLNLFWKQEIDSVFFGYNGASIDSTNPFKLILKLEHLTGEAYFKDNELNMLKLTASNDYLMERDGKNVALWGVRVMPNGIKKEGNCLEGYGVMEWPAEGAVYRGEWYYGMPEGKGKLTLESGLAYEGEFLCGFFWGEGKLNYPGNISYEGSFRMGQRNGYGRAIFNDGSTYEGQWINNMMEGKGIYTFGKKYRYAGNFQNNKFEGQGQLITPEGEHQGTFKDSKPHGPGIMISSRSGNQLQGNWVNGKKEGSFTLKRSDGSTEQVNFSGDIEIR
jgi:hypothetical protein